MLSPAQIDRFKTDGFLVVRGFFDAKNEILPIQEEIRSVIQLVRERERERERERFIGECPLL